jgi:hypothetical protein
MCNLFIQLMFRWNTLPPSSESKCNISLTPLWDSQQVGALLLTLLSYSYTLKTEVEFILLNAWRHTLLAESQVPTTVFGDTHYWQSLRYPLLFLETHTTGRVSGTHYCFLSTARNGHALQSWYLAATHVCHVTIYAYNLNEYSCVL